MNTTSPCHFFHFGLIVTGKAEREHLPKLFRSLMATGVCTFEVVAFTGQRSPRSIKHQLKMVGEGKLIPDRDATEIGLPAREYLNKGPCCFVLLIDDLEDERRPQAREVYARYRQALDMMLVSAKYITRAAVHFLVNMLEAYYFADAQAINKALGLNPAIKDYPGDVETIRNPKHELKQLYPGFKEVEHGGAILDCLDIEHVLSRPDTCTSLRTLFTWCVKVLPRHPHYQAFSIPEYHLEDGTLSVITGPQLAGLESDKELLQ
ncbi:MAG: DUF4276 family protein [Anaerolineae bacterium]|nr:DUF4276 family protein [Anaerolineae bacterium]